MITYEPTLETSRRGGPPPRLTEEALSDPPAHLLPGATAPQR